MNSKTEDNDAYQKSELTETADSSKEQTTESELTETADSSKEQTTESSSGKNETTSVSEETTLPDASANAEEQSSDTDDDVNTQPHQVHREMTNSSDCDDHLLDKDSENRNGTQNRCETNVQNDVIHPETMHDEKGATSEETVSPPPAELNSLAEARAISNAEKSPDSQKEKKQKKSPLKFLQRLTSLTSKKDKKPSKSDILAQITIDSLPQVFVARYLGSRPCTALWGIKHTQKLVQEMIDEVYADKEKLEELPVVSLNISTRGLHVSAHRKNTSSNSSVEYGLIPIEYISYAVQDASNTRVFACIIVSELSSREKKAGCHAYVCESTFIARKVTLSVSLAFKQYSETLKGKPFKFEVDLRSPDELKEELETPDDKEYEA